MLLTGIVVTLVSGMLHWPDGYERWEGTAAELADVAERVAAELGLDEADTRLNERLVRYYAQVGVLERPERKGKEAHFGFRQIAEMIAARVLLRDGWPLAKIAELMRTSDIAAVLGIIPQSHARTRAEELVQRFQRNSGNLFSRAQPQPARRAAAKKKQRADQVRASNPLLALAAPDSAPPPPDQVYVRIEIAPWCHVYVAREELRHMPPDAPEQLGQALAQALIEERLRKGDRK